MYVTETLWPDFSRARLLEALVDFQDRERRYGGLESARGAAHAHKKGTPSGAGHLPRSGRG
jgi:putative undecaprenyl diphosphate synthase